MVLLVFLLAYLVRRRLDAADLMDGDRLWRHWFHQGSRVSAGQETSVLMGLLLVALPALIVGLVLHLLWQTSWKFMVYPVELAGLVFLMGAPGWRQVLQAYSEAWSRGDMQAAWHHARDRLPARERGAALSPEAMHLSLSRALMVAVFGRFFLVAFWFVVGGLPAALLARGVLALSELWPQAGARPRFARIYEWAAWLPVRLVALTFGIAGDLAGWLRVARNTVGAVGKNAGDILMISADGSLTGYALDPSRFSRMHPDEWTGFGGRSLTAVRDLLNRTMLVWLCLLALLVISGAV